MSEVQLVKKKPRQVPLGFSLPDKPVMVSQIQLAKEDITCETSKEDNP